ncbi:hypothetical protein [Tabrizicola sp. YIM 78059]|uniref:hypothetical protein n=1 Tax=Tabrizicola sp. YIM 78059 TaxID=2529861 RepID=UPI0010AAC302|nr:hypothetical protein [Tabrizicola sp. YIM 78059]
MKPTFALDLTRDAIALLHRTPKGWLSIGEVAFDAPDMADALDYLRRTALGLSPIGFATKIILPNSQILYTEIEAPGPSRNDKRRQIAAALEGRTPYAVEDLVFDWSGKGATVKVAVVARETLEEAEAFAVQHRLNPVSFVAIPEEGKFVGEPWFGQTVAADTVLPPGESVDRDREPVTILQRDLLSASREVPVTEPVADASPPEEEPEPASQTPPETLAEPPATPAVAATAADPDEEPLPGLEEALNADLPEVPTPHPASPPATEAAVSEKAGPAPDAVDKGAEAADDDALPESLLRELEREEPPTGTATPDTIPPATDAPVSQPEMEEAPFAHVTDTSAFPEADDIPPMPAGLKPAPGRAEPVEDDIPPASSTVAMVAFASRRAGGSGAAAPVGAATRNETGTARPPAPGARLGQPIPRPAGIKGLSAPVTSPTIPGTRARPKGKAGMPDAAAIATTSGPTTVKSPARPGGTFGTAAPPKSRSGVVFMVLVALLLIFLALVAAWSSFYLARNDAPESDPALASLDATPGVDEEMLADLQDPAELAPSQTSTDPQTNLTAATAGPATEALPVNIAGDGQPTDAPGADLPEDTVATDVAPSPAQAALAAAEPEPDTVAPAAAPATAPEPAPTTAVATDLTAAQAPAEDQDEIFLSAMDAPPPALDALALPAPAVTADAAPDRPMPPPAFGTVYQFGPDGLLKPTPEGILSPDGVMLIAGKPPRVPPPRSEAAAAAALAAAAAAAEPVAATEGQDTTSPADASLVATVEEPAVEPAPSDPSLAGFRPRARPEGLVPATDDGAALVTESASDFASTRPLPRPDAVLAAGSAARPEEAEAEVDLGAQAASLAAQAEARLAAAAAMEAENPSIVAISKRPQDRPRDLSRAVEAAVAAAVREPQLQPEPEVIVTAAAAPAPALKPEELEEVDEPEIVVAAPKIPTKANVAKQATYTKAINLSKLNLIGTYGTDSRRTALIRQSNGRYKKVKVGDKIDGGTIMAITETEVRYQKGGKLLSLKMPKT